MSNPTRSLSDSPFLGSFGFNSGKALVAARVWIGAFALLVAGGVAADWLVPSLRPGLSAAVGRDVGALLDARSPGIRMAGAMLTKVKQALASRTDQTPPALNQAPGSKARVTRDRMIPERSQAANTAPGLASEEIEELLGPLEGLADEQPLSNFTPVTTTSAGGGPIALLGGVGSASGSGGGGPVSGVGPTSPAIETPAAPVPEPSSWTMMIVGFGMAGAALRRRDTKAAVLR